MGLWTYALPAVLVLCADSTGGCERSESATLRVLVKSPAPNETREATPDGISANSGWHWYLSYPCNPSYFDGIQFADANRRDPFLPPTAVIGLRSEPGVAKDRSPAVNIDADRALISFKEMPITPVDPKHQPLDVARLEIGCLAVERAALINDFERRQNPALLDIVEFN